MHGERAETLRWRSVVEVNRLKEKLLYIVRILDQWVAAGGLGCLADDSKRLQWDGAQVIEDGKRVEFVTVGRYGGDDFQG
jgi:myosin I